MLTGQEHERYQRQLLLPEVQEEGQERLKNASVALIGVGGLGSPAATYLAYAGIGKLRLIDRDRVEASNLNRQTLHTPSDIGRPKVESAKDKLAKANPAVAIEACEEEFHAQSAERLLYDIDIALDCLDNLPSRILLNEACFRARIPFVHAAIHGFDGRSRPVRPRKNGLLFLLPGKTQAARRLEPFPGDRDYAGASRGPSSARSSQMAAGHPFFSGREYSFYPNAFARMYPDPGCKTGRLYRLPGLILAG